VRKNRELLWGLTPHRLLLIGFVITFFGAVYMIISKGLWEESVSGGAIVLIGPIPIVLGIGSYSILLVIMAVLLIIMGVALF
jgi:uncharacterized membrane protein